MKKSYLIWMVIVAITAVAAALWWLTGPGVAPVKPAPPPPRPAPIPVAMAGAQPAVAPANEAPPELKKAVGNFILVLEAGDTATFVSDFLWPTAKATAEKTALKNLPEDATPDKRDQILEILQRTEPQLLKQMQQKIVGNPRALQTFQQLAEALKEVQDTAPEMNVIGDRAVYHLNPAPASGLPASVPFILVDGNWTLDMSPTGN